MSPKRIIDQPLLCVSSVEWASETTEKEMGGKNGVR